MKRYLAIKLSALGDTIHAVPAVAALKSREPDCRITWCVEARFAPLVACLDCVDEVLPVRTRSWRKGKELTGETGPRNFLKKLRSGFFDQAFDFQGLLKSAMTGRLARCGELIGWDRPYLREKGAAFFYHRRIGPLPPGLHVLEWCAALVKSAGVPDVPRRFPYSLPAEAAGRVEQLLIEKRIRDGVILNPGAGWPTKMWPAKLFASLGARILDELGRPSLITFGPGEEPLVEEMLQSEPRLIPVRLGILELAALCCRVSCFVGGDTGPMHLASAMGTPVVALFGPTDPARNGPFHEADRVLHRKLPCSGCYRRRCPGCHCLNFTVEEVFQALRQRLHSKEQHGN